MAAVFAVIDPSYTYENSMTDAVAPLVRLADHLSYEHIAGYSLGHYVHFFDSLEKAQNFVAPKNGTRDVDVLRKRSQSAVIEFVEVDNDLVFGNIYTVRDLKESYENSEYGRLEKMWKPEWQERVLNSGDFTQQAARELMKKLMFYRHMLVRENCVEYFKASMPSDAESLALTNNFKMAALSAVVAVAGALAAEAGAPLFGTFITLLGFVGTGKSIYNVVTDSCKPSDRRTAYLENNVFASMKKVEPQVQQQVNEKKTRKLAK